MNIAVNLVLIKFYYLLLREFVTRDNRANLMLVTKNIFTFSECNDYPITQLYKKSVFVQNKLNLLLRLFLYNT